MSTEKSLTTSDIPRWRSFRIRDWLRRMISSEDTSHELALGASIGMFVAFTPLFCLHLAMIIFVAFVLQKVVRFNKALAVATSYVSNPITFAPILWLSYKVGTCLLPASVSPLDHSRVAAGVNWRHGLSAIPRFLSDIGWPMLVGCLILGVAMAVVTYPCTLALVSWYRGRDTVLPPPLGSVSNPQQSASITGYSKPQ